MPEELTADLPVYPQTLRNVSVRARVPFAEVPAVQAGIETCRQAPAGRGRVIVRYSGTELLARVMVEAENPDDVQRHGDRLEELIRKHLGA